MLTIFTTPKPFHDQTGIAQRNALRSWARLKPTPEIILLDDVEGAAETARELGARHIPAVEKNAHGTPLVRSLFETAQAAAHNPVVCYVNADIILLQDAVEAVRRVCELVPSAFLLVSRRWDCNIDAPIDFDNPTWEQDLRACLATNARRESAAAIDCFIFRKVTEWNILPFAIGRSAWDGWFIYNALAKGIPVIDGSDAFIVLHQHHDYWYLERNKKYILMNEECVANQRLRGSFRRQCTIADATQVLSDGALVKPSTCSHLVGDWLRLRMCATYYLRGPLYPFSFPVIQAFLIGKRIARVVARLRRRRTFVPLPRGVRPR